VAEQVFGATAKQIFAAPIVTTIEAARTFWKAEDISELLCQNSTNPTACLPWLQVAKVRAKYAERREAGGIGRGTF